jgi:hypothetical protein
MLARMPAGRRQRMAALARRAGARVRRARVGATSGFARAR